MLDRSYLLAYTSRVRILDSLDWSLQTPTQRHVQRASRCVNAHKRAELAELAAEGNGVWTLESMYAGNVAQKRHTMCFVHREHYGLEHAGFV
jgi:hypothetical protein